MEDHVGLMIVAIATQWGKQHPLVWEVEAVNTDFGVVLMWLQEEFLYFPTCKTFCEPQLMLQFIEIQSQQSIYINS